VTLVAGVISCVLDLLTTSLPIPMIMRLQMHPWQRAGAFVLLSLGFIVTVAGIIRYGKHSNADSAPLLISWLSTYYIWKSLVLSYDETWFAYPLWIAAAVEVDLAIITACAPALGPFLLKHFRPLITSLLGSRNKGQSKNDGYVSAQCGPSGTEATFYAFDEKINSGIETYERAKSPGMKLEKQPQNERMAIVQRQSWEVSWQAQKEEEKGKLRHRLYEDDYTIGVAISSDSDQERHERARRVRSQNSDLAEARKLHELSAPPQILPPEPLSPFTWTESEMARSRSGTLEVASRDGEIAWRSDTERTEGFKPASVRKHSESTPVPELQDGEMRWNIERKPFRESGREEQKVNGRGHPISAGERTRGIELKDIGRSRS
jgi:hypothetical protein